MSSQAETHLHMATQTCYLNLLISIPHFFAFSSALVSSFPVGALPPLSFLCCFKASATVKPGAPDLIISSSSSSSSSSSPRMGPVDNGSCCLTARFAGFFLFPPVPETVEEGAFDDESESCLNLVISNKLSRCGGDGGGGGLVGGAVEGPPSLFFFAIVRDANDKSGMDGAGGGGDDDRGTGDGGMLAGALPGDGNGELRDFNDIWSSLRRRSISSFFLRCS
mmetsp:Transcript_10072/g.21809  ORF Transcript_10072/g.21809 Transcript_10072/m.21809 type:complete len:222 (-) Transcript_10072:1827-2492(-)